MTFYFIASDLWILNYQQGNWHNKWLVNIWCSSKIIHAVDLLLQKIKLCSFTNLISQKISASAVISTINSCISVQVLHSRLARKARVLDYCLPTIRPFQKNFFKEYFFSRIVDFGVPFSINFLTSSAFLGFRKALEQDAMSSSVSVVRKISKHVLDLISLLNNFMRNFFFCMPISNVHKSVIVVNSIETRFSRNVFEVLQ